MSPERKRLLVVGAIAVVAVLVFVVGVGFGGRQGGADRWQDRLSGVGVGEALTTSDLVRTSGDCDVTGQQVVVQGACAFEVAATGGRFALGSPTRRVTLVNGPTPLRLTMTVEDQDIEVDLDPGEDVRLTMGRSRGSLALRCLGAFDCGVTLVPPS